MWYGVEYADGSAVVNAVYEFTRRELRDAWVRAGAPSGAGERRALTARDPLVRSTPRWGRIDGDSAAWRVLAEQRVARSPNLARYASDILYDWGPNGELWRWLATAPERAIVSWVAEMQAREQALAEASVE